MAETVSKDKFKQVFKDIDREIAQEGKIVQHVFTAQDQERIIRQLQQEWQVCWPYNEAKRKVMLRRLRLYNNQRRNVESVGDPLMFTVFNTIHASLWDDRLQAEWNGRSGQGDEDVESNLNALSEYDYDIMQKAELDYSWNWDAEFFGRGLVLLMDFDRTEGIMAPVPEHIDATTFVRDPRAKSVNGDMRGRGAMRFGGWETRANYWELKDLPAYFNLNALRKDRDIRSLTDELDQAKRDAQGLQHFPQKQEALDKYGNYEFRLLNWFTTIKGDKYLITSANNRSIIIRCMKLDNNNKWPLIDRAIYPMASDWDGVSIPDLTEDKQRGKAILLNIGMESAKGEVAPVYLFDQTRIKNKNDLNFKVNKFIGVDGRVDNAIAPVQKSTAHQYADVIMNVLDVSAQRATAATELRQGIPAEGDPTLGEQELAVAAGNKRFSMNAKIYGLSDANFWRQYYRLYKKNFKDKIDEKIIRIQGALAPIWRPLTRENIISPIDPDVKVKSLAVSEAERARKTKNLIDYSGIVLQDPSNNRRYIQRVIGKNLGHSEEQLDMMFPPTVDHIQAKEENDLLNAEKLPKISIQDDHMIHLEVHNKANQNKQTLAHIRAHKTLMVTKRNRPELFAPPEEAQFDVPGANRVRPEAPAPSPTDVVPSPTQ